VLPKDLGGSNGGLDEYVSETGQKTNLHSQLRLLANANQIEYRGQFLKTLAPD
jgi:hypothetical protein